MWFIHLDVMDAVPSILAQQANMFPLEFRSIKRIVKETDLSKLIPIIKTNVFQLYVHCQVKSVLQINKIK